MARLNSGKINSRIKTTSQAAGSQAQNCWRNTKDITRNRLAIIRFGVVELSDGRITRLVEKPDRPPSNRAIVGVYFIRDSRKLFGALHRLIENDRRTRGEYQLTDALQLLIEQGETLRVREVEHWLDCGTADALLDTNRHLLRRDGHARPRPGVVFVDPIYIDDEATVANSVIGPDVSIGAGATVRNSVISDSIINRDARVEGALLARSIIGRDSVVRDLPRRLNLGDSSEYRVMPDDERPDRR